jgi:hypothetical protein
VQKNAKPAVAVLATLFALLLWQLFKETSWALTLEATLEHFAEWIGIPRPTLVAAAFPFVLAIAAMWVLAWASYSLGLRDRALKAEFEFVYDPNDPRFVKVGPHKTTYFVGLRIKAQRTIDSPSVLALDGPFTERVIRGAGASLGPPGYFFLYRGGALDPEVTETIELFDLPFSENLPKEETDLLRHTQTFTLEARGRDARPVTAVFEYNPPRNSNDTSALMKSTSHNCRSELPHDRKNTGKDDPYLVSSGGRNSAASFSHLRIVSTSSETPHLARSLAIAEGCGLRDSLGS